MANFADAAPALGEAFSGLADVKAGQYGGAIAAEEMNQRIRNQQAALKIQQQYADQEATWQKAQAAKIVSPDVAEKLKLDAFKTQLETIYPPGSPEWKQAIDAYMGIPKPPAPAHDTKLQQQKDAEAALGRPLTTKEIERFYNLEKPPGPSPAEKDEDKIRTHMRMVRDAQTKLDKAKPGSEEWKDAKYELEFLSTTLEKPAMLYKQMAEPIAKAIENFKFPPDLKGISRTVAPYVFDKLAEDGFDYSKHYLDWIAATKHTQTMHGVPMIRMMTAINFARESLPLLKALYNGWKEQAGVSGYQVFNAATLKLMMGLPGKPGAFARALTNQINDMRAEMAVVYKGGNTMTDEALKSASTQFGPDWNEEQFNAGLVNASNNLDIRMRSLLLSNTAGLSGEYLPSEPSSLRKWDNGMPKQLASGVVSYDPKRLLAKLNAGEMPVFPSSAGNYVRKQFQYMVGGKPTGRVEWRESWDGGKTWPDVDPNIIRDPEKASEVK